MTDRGEEMEVVRLALKALGNASVNKENKERVAKMGALPHLITRVRSSTTAVAEEVRAKAPSSFGMGARATEPTLVPRRH